MLLEEQLQQAKVKITYLKAENKNLKITCQQYVVQHDTLQQHVKDLLRKRLSHCKMLENIEALLFWNVSKKKRTCSFTA